MKMSEQAMKTAIAAESGFVIAGMPVSFIASATSVAIVIGWAGWRLFQHRHSLRIAMRLFHQA